MPLTRTEKEDIVREVHEQALQSSAIVVVENTGLSVVESTAIRRDARDVGVQLRVIRNRIATRAFEDTPHECLQPILDGPNLFAFSGELPGASAKLLREWQRKTRNFEIRGISLGKDLLEADKLAMVANLPGHEEAIAQLLSVMKAPITKLAQTLSAVPTKLVRTLDAVRQAKADA